VPDRDGAAGDPTKPSVDGVLDGVESEVDAETVSAVFAAVVDVAAVVAVVAVVAVDVVEFPKRDDVETGA
jgi:hypothetical protein